MSFGEMMITLNNVACLLHLLIKGYLWDVPLCINKEGVDALVVELLRVTIEDATQETRTCKGSKL